MSQILFISTWSRNCSTGPWIILFFSSALIPSITTLKSKLLFLEEYWNQDTELQLYLARREDLEDCSITFLRIIDFCINLDKSVDELIHMYICSTSFWMHNNILGFIIQFLMSCQDTFEISLFYLLNNVRIMIHGDGICGG